jgi:hypothetical protein
VEVSIEADESPAIIGLGQRQVFVEVDPEWKVRDQVNPATLWIQIADVDRERPFAPECRSGKADHLS